MPQRTCVVDGCNNPCRRKYCSKRCANRQSKRNIQADPERWRAYLDRQNERPRYYTGLTCVWCQSTFTARKKAARYCSIECDSEAKRWAYRTIDRSPLTYANCRSCSKIYIKRGGRCHCSPACKQDFEKKTAPPFDCSVCGQGVIPGSTAHWQAAKYCGSACRTRAGNQKQKANGNTRRARDRRRARKKNAYVEDVSRDRIFKRDRFRCQLCGRPVAKKEKAPHPQAPVLDHIVPLAEGGTHEPKNVQTAHFICNSTKSSGTWPTGEQLRLVG